MDIHIQTLNDLPATATEFIERVGHRKVFAFEAEMGRRRQSGRGAGVGGLKWGGDDGRG